jgi:TRAP-type C4-dicarboxylate transport system, periplasmic component
MEENKIMRKFYLFRKKIKAFVFFSVISAIGTIIIFDDSQAQEYILKLGTLAPAGSSWFDKLSEFKNEVETKTNGKIKIIIYSGGVAGDEIEMVRKMQSGKIQGAALIIKGMKEIAPELDFLDIPFMFKNYDEVRKIYNKMGKEIDRNI